MSLKRADWLPPPDKELKVALLTIQRTAVAYRDAASQYEAIAQLLGATVGLPSKNGRGKKDVVRKSDDSEHGLLGPKVRFRSQVRRLLALKVVASLETKRKGWNRQAIEAALSEDRDFKYKYGDLTEVLRTLTRAKRLVTTGPPRQFQYKIGKA